MSRVAYPRDWSEGCPLCGSRAWQVDGGTRLRGACGSTGTVSGVEYQSEACELIVELRDDIECCRFEERNRIRQVVAEWGIPGPVTESKGVPCEHEQYAWNECYECARTGLLAMIDDVEGWEELW